MIQSTFPEHNFCYMKKREIVENGGIEMPVIKYKKVPQVDSEKVFNGDVTPIPDVLVEYLDKTELKIFAVILKQWRHNGCCVMRLSTLGKILQLTSVSINGAVSRLRSMGLIYYEIYGRKRNKKIDFEVIQYLNDLLAEKKIGAATALRKKAKNKNIMSLPPTTLQYLERNFGYSDDKTENEEYE